MKTTIDTDAILFGILKGSSIKSEIKGGIYVGDDRPDDSGKEDIVINSIYLTHDYHPQIGTSNINIFVPDKIVKINNVQQIKSNRTRLNELSKKVIDVLKQAKVHGLKFVVEGQSVLAETTVKQHFTNIRISWNIQID